jgi:alanyl-tRNA synthetase
LLPVSKALMQTSYPEVSEQWPRVSQVAYAEEEAFRRTLASGTQIFDLAVQHAKQSGHSAIPGDQAFQLHDTYGFPIDLTLEMANEAGLEVDQVEFRRLMQEQRERARADAKAKKGGTLATEAYRELREAGEIPFLGYTDLTAETKVRGIIADGKLVGSASLGQQVEVVLEASPFYAESGGQDADTGLITGAGFSLEVLDVQKPVQGLIVHKVVISDGELATGMAATANVDAYARAGSCQAHTATHIINAGLRQILGPSTAQQGSYNKPGYLRFDFNTPQGLSKAMQEELEGISNEAIRANYEVTATEMPIAEAKALGAQAMFGEKYGDIVRMVELAGPWSRELCGGTHVATTAEIGLLSLLGESSVGSGIRRVEAFVSADAFANLAAERALVATLAETLKTQPDQLVDRVGKLMAELKSAQKELAAFKAKQLLENVPALLQGAQAVGPYELIANEFPGTEGEELRNLAIQVREALGTRPGVVAFVGGTAKPVLIVAATPAARALGAKSGQLVGVGAVELGGRGGGRDDLAQGGGTNPAGAKAALAAIEAALRG